MLIKQLRRNFSTVHPEMTSWIRAPLIFLELGHFELLRKSSQGRKKEFSHFLRYWWDMTVSRICSWSSGRSDWSHGMGSHSIRATKPESFTSSLHPFFIFFRLCMSGPGGMLASLNTGSPGETTVGQNLLTIKAGLFIWYSGTVWSPVFSYLVPSHYWCMWSSSSFYSFFLPFFSTVWDAPSSPFTDSSTVQVRLLHQLNQLLKVALSLALAFLSRFSFSASRLP